MAPVSLLAGYQDFEKTYCFHRQEVLNMYILGFRNVGDQKMLYHNTITDQKFYSS